MSGRNQLCSLGQHISEQEECEEAAKYLGKEFKDSRNKVVFPKGCYYLYQNSIVYFNTNPWGNANWLAEQICTQQQTQGT